MKHIIQQIQAADKHFVNGTDLYSLDSHALNAWNSLMGNNALAVYRPEEHRGVRWKGTEVKIDSVDVFVVLVNGNIIHLTVSEWTAFTRVGKVSQYAFREHIVDGHLGAC